VSGAFTDQMVKLSRAVKVGNGMEDGVQMGPLATGRQLQRTQRLVADARAKGAKLACGGGRPGGLNHGYFFEPTILTDLSPDAAVLHEEPFSPIAAVVPVGSAEEAVTRANEVEFGLAAYVFGKSGNALDMVAAELQAGVIGVNTVAVATPEAPFGGVKQSGYGREGGIEGIHDFLNAKFVHRVRG
jgi:succinate-semialdehyde dehydrogenase/glutarate-semialdehyde dehydrogenase